MARRTWPPGSPSCRRRTSIVSIAVPETTPSCPRRETARARDQLETAMPMPPWMITGSGAAPAAARGMLIRRRLASGCGADVTVVTPWPRPLDETPSVDVRNTRMTSPTDEFLELQAALAGEYSLQRELGRGGMGIVYLARDVQLDRDVAIKVLPAHLARTAESRARFVREARTAAGLSHPHIVPIHRVGESAGFVYFVMSYVEGETLGERLRRDGPLAPADATRVLREVAWALAYAHGRGIVHRDVKPDNILIEAGTGRAMVTDFGIAHGGATSVSSTDPGKIMGTANFMSPEQAAGEPIDGRSDMYALGVVGYLAVSGRLPFEASNLPALLVRQ